MVVTQRKPRHFNQFRDLDNYHMHNRFDDISQLNFALIIYLVTNLALVFPTVNTRKLVFKSLDKLL